MLLPPLFPTVPMPAATGVCDLSELCLKHTHSTILQSQSVFQFPQARLQVRLFPALQHGSFGLFEPLLAQMGPFRHGLGKRVVFLRDARAQMLDLRTSRLAGEPALGTPELTVEQRALNPEPRHPLQIARQPKHTHAADEPL